MNIKSRSLICLVFTLASGSANAQSGKALALSGQRDQCEGGLLSFDTQLLSKIPKAAPKLISNDQSPTAAMSTEFHPDWNVINQHPLFSLGHDSQGTEFFLITDPVLAQEVLKAPQTAKSVPQQRASSAAPQSVRKDLVGGDIFLGDGERWQFIRKLLQPEFTPRAVRSRTSRIASVVDDFSKLSFDRLADQSEGFDLFPLLHQMAFDVLLQTAFGLHDHEQMKQLFNDWSFVYYELNNLAPLRSNYPPERFEQFEAARKRVNRTIAAILATRRSAQDRSTVTNLLDLMLNSTDESGQPLSDERIMGEMRTLFTAGSDTTAGLTFWTLIHLLKSPERLKAVRAEMLAALAEKPLTQDSLSEMPLLKAHIQETLRLHPGLPRIFSSFSQDAILAGYLVPKGSRIVIRLDLFHENPKYWSHPEQYDPERFLGENANISTKGCYIPFGSGPRACLGRELAIVESMSTLALLLTKYDWQMLQEPRSTELMGLVRYPDQKESGRFQISRRK